MSGNHKFVKETLVQLHDTNNVFVSVELNRLKSARTLKLDWNRGLQVLQEFGLQSFKLRDSKCGGATDAAFLFDVSSGPGFGVLPGEGNMIERLLRHFLDGGVETVPEISEVDKDVIQIVQRKYP